MVTFEIHPLQASAHQSASEVAMEAIPAPYSRDFTPSPVANLAQSSCVSHDLSGAECPAGSKD